MSFAEEDDDDPVLAAALEDDTNLEDEQMATLMGFSNFDSTKVWIYVNCNTEVIRYMGASENYFNSFSTWTFFWGFVMKTPKTGSIANRWAWFSVQLLYDE